MKGLIDMSDVDVFVIDDDFDPLADLSLDDGERERCRGGLPAAHPRCRQERGASRGAVVCDRAHREAAGGHSRPAVPPAARRGILHRAEDDGRGRGQFGRRRIRTRRACTARRQVVQLLFQVNAISTEFIAL